MSKTLKDLNWNLYIVNMSLAIFTALGIILAGDFTLKGGVAIILSLVVKDNISFFSEAKRVFTQKVKNEPRKR